MSQNELQNALLHPATSAPASPKAGQFYTDTSKDEAVLMFFNGKKWIAMTPTTPEKIPTKVEPSISIQLADVDTSSVEVGTIIPVNYIVTLDPGSYQYGPETGVVAESCRVYMSNDPSHVATGMSGTFADVVASDGADYEIIAEVSHSAGVIPVTDQGSPCPSAQIVAGIKAASSGSITGIRKYFYGTTESMDTVDSDMIRSLTHSTGAIEDGTSINLKIKDGANQVIIAFPSSANLVLSSVVDTGAFNIEVSDVFRLMNIDVEGANGYEAVSYDVYVYSPEVSLSSNTYKVTISEKEE